MSVSTNLNPDMRAGQLFSGPNDSLDRQILSMSRNFFQHHEMRGQETTVRINHSMLKNPESKKTWAMN